MKSYEEKLLAAFEEARDKRVFGFPKRKKAPKVLMWLNHRFGWEIPAPSHMSFLENAVFFGSVFVPTKLMLDFFFFQERSFMTTTGYWLGFVFSIFFMMVWMGGFYRFIARKKGLSRWEDL